MWLFPIQVECYSGWKADESPQRFLWKERWIEVNEIVDRWYQGHRDPEWPVADYFKVSASDGHSSLLKHDLESDDWHVAREWRRRGNYGEVL